MTATIQKWGNSGALRIPLTVAKQIRVQEGDAVTLRVSSAGLTVKPAPKRQSLDDLLAQVTPEKPAPSHRLGRGCRPGGVAGLKKNDASGVQMDLAVRE